MWSDYPLIMFSIYIPLLPFGIGLLFFKRLEVERRALTILVGLAALVQILGLYFTYHPELNNIPLYSLYTPIEFLIYCFIYRSWFKGWVSPRLIEGIGFAFLLFYVGNALWLQPMDTNNTYSILVAGILLILFSILFFYRVISEMSLGPLEKSPAFWINASVLLYYAGSILILGLDNFKEGSLAQSVWIFHSSFNILHYLLLTVGLWIPPPPKS